LESTWAGKEHRFLGCLPGCKGRLAGKTCAPNLVSVFFLRTNVFTTSHRYGIEMPLERALSKMLATLLKCGY